MEKMKFSPYSEYAWDITPPSLDKFTEDFQQAINTGGQFTITSAWTFNRDYPIGYEDAGNSLTTTMNATDFAPIIELLNSEDTSATSAGIVVDDIFPKLLTLGSTTETSDF